VLLSSGRRRHFVQIACVSLCVEFVAQAQAVLVTESPALNRRFDVLHRSARYHMTPIWLITRHELVSSSAVWLLDTVDRVLVRLGVRWQGHAVQVAYLLRRIVLIAQAQDVFVAERPAIL
jgi:hypothetical protein